MAIPQSAGVIYGAAFLPSDGAAYAYNINHGSLPWYFAGEFFVDTGHDDPVTHTLGVEAAELYGARVYPTSHSTGINGGSYSPTPQASWVIQAQPVWKAVFSGTSGVTNRRILIKCTCYVSPVDPVPAATYFYRLNAVDWTLYRV